MLCYLTRQREKGTEGGDALLTSQFNGGLFLLLNLQKVLQSMSILLITAARKKKKKKKKERKGRSRRKGGKSIDFSFASPRMLYRTQGNPHHFLPFSRFRFYAQPVVRELSLKSKAEQQPMCCCYQCKIRRFCARRRRAA